MVSSVVKCHKLVPDSRGGATVQRFHSVIFVSYALSTPEYDAEAQVRAQERNGCKKGGRAVSKWSGSIGILLSVLNDIFVGIFFVFVFGVAASGIPFHRACGYGFHHQ